MKHLLTNKKGFTFYLAVLAFIGFLFVLGLFWWKTIQGCSIFGDTFGGRSCDGSSLVTSVCGTGAEHCQTTQELELLGYLKYPLDVEGTTISLADVIVQHFTSPRPVSRSVLTQHIDAVIPDTRCMQATVTSGRLSNPHNLSAGCKQLLLYPISTTLYTKNTNISVTLYVADAFAQTLPPSYRNLYIQRRTQTEARS